MLEFIVLGNVPGTSFQITFNWVLIISGILVGVPVLQAMIKQTYRMLKHTKIPAEETNLQVA